MPNHNTGVTDLLQQWWPNISIQSSRFTSLQKPQLSAGGGQQPQQLGHVTVNLHQKQSRMKPAYMFFRDDWIKTQKQCSAGCVNPATKEFWDSLKRSFAALNPEHRAYYEHLSQQSAMLAKQKRDSVAKSSLPSPNYGCSDQIAKLAPDQALAMNPWVAHPNDLDKHANWDGISQEIMDSCSSISSSPSKLLGDDVHDCSPISEEMLERAWKRNLADGLTWADNLARFDKEAQQFAEPPRDAPAFPKRVFYQGCCGSFCRRHNPADQVQFFTRLTAAFSSLVKQLGAAASGIHSAQQSFILTEQMEILFDTHFKVKLATLPPTQSKRSFSASAEPIGPLHQLTGDQFAEYLLNLQDGQVPEIFLKTACIRRLRFEDVSLSTVQVVGYDDAFVPIVLPMGDGEDSGQEALPDQHISETPSVLEDNTSDLVDDGDLLAMVCKNDASADRKPKKPRTHVQGSKSMAQIKESIVSDVPCDRYTSIYVLEDELTRADMQSKVAKAIRDESMVASIDEETAQCVLHSVQQCEEKHSANVDPTCTFDLDPEPQHDSSEMIDETSNLGNAESESKQSMAENAPPEISHVGSASSSSAHPVQAAAFENATQEVVLAETPGKMLKIIHHKECKYGNLVCELRHVHSPSGISTPVGRVTLMTGRLTSSYKAHCSIHKSCQCWVQSVSSRHLDLLVDWLKAGPDSTPIQHEALSRELRISCGMKVRK